MTEHNKGIRAEMDALLRQSDETVRILGELVFSSHQSGMAMTDKFWQERERLRQKIGELTQQWKERYNSYYKAGI